MSKGGDVSPRLQINVSAQTFAYLELLKGKGTHGNSVPSVARTLIEMGIREALEKGHLTTQDRDRVQQISGS